MNMLLFVKAFAVILAIVALIVPIAASSACDNSHDTACATDCSCVCVCHTTPAFGYHENTSMAIAMIAQRAVISDPLRLEILLAADIFRPPTCV
jgi:hypothetical protein